MSNDYEATTVNDEEIKSPVAFIVNDGKVKSINYISNVVDEPVLRRIQSEILDDLSKTLIKSFGPHGSITCIKKLNAQNMYTKDGYTILKAKLYNGVIEQSIKDDIENITLNIVKTVGDGTTSAVLLSKYIFDALMRELSTNADIFASDIMRAMDKIGKELDEAIRESSHETTVQDIYDIAYVSSDGDYWVAQWISEIYKKSGMGVFIDVAATTASDPITIKEYDGMTIDSGFMDSCFVTDASNNTSTVDHPEIYFFDDPIDTKEVGVILDAILSENIIVPYNRGVMSGNFSGITPTVIVCPKISRDMSSLIDQIVDLQSKMKPGNKLPINFVINRTQPDQIRDIYQLCGAKPIIKYMDAEVYKADVEAGRACTVDNFKEFCGNAESVVSNSEATKFIEPNLMRDGDDFSNVYKNLLAFVEAEIKKNESDGGDVRELGTLKRRLHALKSNLVEIKVGGMSPSDRDALLHRVEDAVKNCRSAAKYGTGWGANVSGYLAISDLEDEIDTAGATDSEKIVVNAIYDAYTQLVIKLYETKYTSEEAANYADETITTRMPLNLRNSKFDGIVKSSIESDTIILNSVLKIVGLMVSCNQFMLPTAQHNVYSDTKEIK